MQLEANRNSNRTESRSLPLYLTAWDEQTDLRKLTWMKPSRIIESMTYSLDNIKKNISPSL